MNHPNQFLFFRYIALSFAAFFLLTCQRAEKISEGEQPLFSVLSPDSTGLKFINQIQETALANVLSYQYFYNGGGVAVGDINNDGLEDLFFTSNQQSNKLFLNLGKLQFKDITMATGTGGREGSWTTGAAIVDINSDGLKDIYVCYSGDLEPSRRKNQLFVNQGLDKQGIPYFKEMAEEFGLADPAYSVASYFSDLDRDGDLDMLLLNHNPSLFTHLNEQAFKAMLQEYDPMSSSKVYRNEGGKFYDVSKEIGLSGSPLSYGLGAVISDFNQDGWPDIYLGNDYSSPDYFYVNQKDGTFKNELGIAFSITSHYSMGVDAADFNQDGWADLVSLDMLPASNKRQKLLHSPENYEHYQLFVRSGLHHQVMRNMLQLNNQNGTFSEIGNFSGIEATDWSWAPLAADFDNDGWTDLFISNGFLKDFTNLDFINYRNTQLGNTHVTTETVQDLIQKMPATKVGNFAFRNRNGTQFQDVSQEWGMTIPGNSNGALYADLDQDGDLDLVLNNLNEPAQILVNTASERGNRYLQIQLEGPAGNPSGIGSKVWVYSHGKFQFQEQLIYKGYQGNVSEILHFGLAQQAVDSIKVEWSDGRKQVVLGEFSDELLKISYQNSAVIEGHKTTVKPYWKKMEEWSLGLNDASLEDFKSQNQLLYSQRNAIIHFSKGDLNRDGIEDLVFSDGKGNVWSIDGVNKSWYQKEKLISGIQSGVSDLELRDLDGDGRVDLIVSGRDAEYGSRIYFQGDDFNFGEELVLSSKGQQRLTSKVLPWDFDQDGDLDLVLGGTYLPGRWPESSPTLVFENLGKKEFKLLSSPTMDKISRVNDLILWDENEDGKEEMWVAAEFEPIRTIGYESGEFLVTDSGIPNQNRGLWRKLYTSKAEDGSELLFVGNWGLNSRLEADSEQPLKIYYADFDQNGSVDPLMEIQIQGELFPFFSRDELSNQLYKKKAKFPDHEGFSNVKISGILDPEEMEKATVLKVDTLASMAFEKTKGSWSPVPLPVDFQFSPVSVLIGPGSHELLVMGNLESTRLKIGKLSANPGVHYRISNGKKIHSLGSGHTGINLRQEVVDAILLDEVLWVSTASGKIIQYQKSK